MRVEWELDGFDLDLGDFAPQFAPDRRALPDAAGGWSTPTSRPRVAMFVSRYDHCLVDLLYRHQAGELHCDIPLIIGNHPDAEALADFYGMPFHHIPVDAGDKAEAESAAARPAARSTASTWWCWRATCRCCRPTSSARYPQRIINIHHSFLPAFRGARPYHRAFERGVKLIGATSHYVTEELDEGPIIEQDVVAHLAPRRGWRT